MWCGVVWYGMVSYDVMWYGMVCYDMMFLMCVFACVSVITG